MIGLAGIYPDNWRRVCAALAPSADLDITADVEASATSSRLTRTHRPVEKALSAAANIVADRPVLSDELTPAESRDDCYRSYLEALASMRRR